MPHKAIEEYGVIGDLNTVALVGIDGSIDFMCFPHFDSPSVFTSLLDERDDGFFSLAPQMDPVRNRQLYLPDTNVLLTRFLGTDGVAELSDVMPVAEAGCAHNILRRVKTVRGRLTYRMVCSPRFDYARADHRAEATRDGALFVSRGRDGTALRLRASVPVEVRNGRAEAEFALAAGEEAWFVLEQAREGEEHTPCSAPSYSDEAFHRTVSFWRSWIGRSTYRGRWREMVDRSALTLKMLTSREHGSIVAAPTFGLPEEVGGVRNWDYRYTWIRDASFTLYALSRLGLQDEAAAFFGWLEERCADLDTDGSLQIMYGLDGRKELPEEELGHLSGYRDSKPVRIGNAAHSQLQLDIYGEMMDSLYLYDKYGEAIPHHLWQSVSALMQWVCDNWHLPDEGIWEIRGGRRCFLHSRIMCWVALDRAIRLARRRSLPADLSAWMKCRDAIHRDVFTHFWDADRRTFVQAKGEKALDAATLLMPLVRMIGPTDPLWRSTMAAIEHELVSDSLVYRYNTESTEGREATDGLFGAEGTFSICSFWYVEALSRAGQLDKARFYFEKMLGYANHVGLYAEELGPCGEHLGNFPQAFTHLALISAAFDLDRRLSPRET